VDPGIKIKGAYYQDMLLKQEMLPDICAIFGDLLTFQQHSAPTGSYAGETVALLTARGSVLHCCQSATSQQPRPQPCWLQGVGTMQDHVYWVKVRAVDDLKQCWHVRQSGANCHDDMIDQRRSRLHACVHAKGGLLNSLCESKKGPLYFCL